MEQFTEHVKRKIRCVLHKNDLLVPVLLKYIPVVRIRTVENIRLDFIKN